MYDVSVLTILMQLIHAANVLIFPSCRQMEALVAEDQLWNLRFRTNQLHRLFSCSNIVDINSSTLKTNCKHEAIRVELDRSHCWIYFYLNQSAFFNIVETPWAIVWAHSYISVLCLKAEASHPFVIFYLVSKLTGFHINHTGVASRYKNKLTLLTGQELSQSFLFNCLNLLSSLHIEHILRAIFKWEQQKLVVINVYAKNHWKCRLLKWASEILEVRLFGIRVRSFLGFSFFNKLFSKCFKVVS